MYMRDPPMYLEFFVECKYRHDSVNWVFTPEEDNWQNFEFSARDMFTVLDNVVADLAMDDLKLDFIRESYPLCSKGIELTPDGANPKAITQAVQQLSYAIADQAPEAIEHQLDSLLGHPSPVWALVPIVVTTATLWKMKTGQTLASIREATSIDAVADRCDSLVLHQHPDNLQRKFTLDSLHRSKMEVRTIAFTVFLPRSGFGIR